MRGLNIIRAVALAAVASMPVTMLGQTSGQFAMAAGFEPAPLPARRRLKRSVAGAQSRHRNRWKAARPKRRPNRLHISRRVRRRHRRRA